MLIVPVKICPFATLIVRASNSPRKDSTGPRSTLVIRNVSAEFTWSCIPIDYFIFCSAIIFNLFFTALLSLSADELFNNYVYPTSAAS